MKLLGISYLVVREKSVTELVNITGQLTSYDVTAQVLSEQHVTHDYKIDLKL